MRNNRAGKCILNLIIICLCFFSGSEKIWAQTPQVLISETEIDFTFETEKPLVHTFEFASRALISEHIDREKTSDYEHEFVELTYAPYYVLSEQSNISLGLRFRLENSFDETESNEVRIIPQYEYDHSIPGFELSHSVRMESRFRGKEYVFRPRYEFGISRALGANYEAELSTEALWSISPQSFPEYEQRFALELERVLSKKVEIVVGFEFRLEDYVHSLEHEYFILTGANILL